MPRRIRSTGLLTATALGASLVSSPLAAQGGSVSPQCSSADRPLQDACQKSVDLFDFMAPQLGTALAGGNAVIGQGGAFGRLGRLSVGLRATAFDGTLPDLGTVSLSTSGPQSTNIGVSKQYLGAPSADAALAVFGGLPLGPVRVGALDVLGTATYIPTFESGGFSVRNEGGSVKIGYGARLGLLQEGRALPGVAVTYLRRDLPQVDIVGSVAAGGSRIDDTVGVRSLKSGTDAWRVVAGKRLAFIGLSAGAGQDRYKSSAALGAVVNEAVLGFPVTRFEADDVKLAQSMTRTSYFADLSFNFPGVRLAGEIGRAQGGNVRTSYNSFDNGRARAQDDITYYGFSLRIGI